MLIKNILALGAHFDDIELGAGGSLAKFSKEGKKVYKLILTDDSYDNKLEETLKVSKKSCKILGIVETLLICNNFTQAQVNSTSKSFLQDGNKVKKRSPKSILCGKSWCDLQIIFLWKRLLLCMYNGLE